MVKLIPDGELTFRSHENLMSVVDALLDEDFVLLLSREEELYILNYIWSPNCSDRNDVVFMDRDEFDDNFLERSDCEYESGDYRMGEVM